jgi:hypothetical protein
MSRVFGMEAEYALISIKQWEQLDAALGQADLRRVRELWDSWRVPTWAGDVAADHDLIDPGR